MLALQLDEESPDEEVELSENFTANVNRNDHGEPQNVEDFFTELELSTKNKQLLIYSENPHKSNIKQRISNSSDGLCESNSKQNNTNLKNNINCEISKPF